MPVKVRTASIDAADFDERFGGPGAPGFDERFGGPTVAGLEPRTEPPVTWLTWADDRFTFDQITQAGFTFATLP